MALRRRHLRLAVPLLVVVTVILVAVFADALAPFDPTAQHLTYRLRPPRWAPAAIRASCSAQTISVATSSAGCLWRAGFAPDRASCNHPRRHHRNNTRPVVGVFRGAVDSVVTKLIDIQLSFPFILFAIAVIAVAGPKLWVLVMVLAARSWTTFARVVRGETFTISGNDT